HHHHPVLVREGGPSTTNLRFCRQVVGGPPLRTMTNLEWSGTMSDIGEYTIVKAAEAFARAHLAPNAARWHREGRMQVEGLQEAARVGLLGFQTSREWGGSGIGFLDKLRLLETLSRHSYDFAFGLTNTAGCCARIASEMPRHVAERYVPAM